MNILEWIAVVFGFASVYFCIKANPKCWPFGFCQVLLYVFVFYRAKLYSDMLLNIIYVGIQLYGWHSWLFGGQRKTALAASRITAPQTGGLICLGIIGSALWGYGMAHYTDAAAPYADAFITVMSLIAMGLQVRKKFENWHFWIAVNLVGIAVYISKNLYASALLYAVFTIMCVEGLKQWRIMLKSPDTFAITPRDAYSH